MLDRTFKVSRPDGDWTVVALRELHLVMGPLFHEFLAEEGFLGATNSLVTLESFADWLLFKQADRFKEI